MSIFRTWSSWGFCWRWTLFSLIETSENGPRFWPWLPLLPLGLYHSHCFHQTGKLHQKFQDIFLVRTGLVPHYHSSCLPQSAEIIRETEPVLMKLLPDMGKRNNDTSSLQGLIQTHLTLIFLHLQKIHLLTQIFSEGHSREEVTMILTWKSFYWLLVLFLLWSSTLQVAKYFILVETTGF